MRYNTAITLRVCSCKWIKTAYNHILDIIFVTVSLLVIYVIVTKSSHTEDNDISELGLKEGVFSRMTKSLNFPNILDFTTSDLVYSHSHNKQKLLNNVQELRSLPNNWFDNSLIKINEGSFEAEQLEANCEILHRQSGHYQLPAVETRKLDVVLYWWILDQERNMAACLSPKSGSTMYQYLYQAIRLREMAYLIPGETEEANAQRKSLNPEYEFRSSIVNPPKWKPPQKTEAINYIQQPITNRLILVRHPLDRLYSGYKDKFNKNKQDYQKIFAPIAQKILVNYASRMITFKNTDTFEINFQSFLNYIVSEPEHSLDAHFRTATTMCQLCKIKYNYIVRQEDMKHDMLDSIDFMTKYEKNSLKEEDIEFLNKIKKEHINREYIVPSDSNAEEGTDFKNKVQQVAGKNRPRLSIFEGYTKAPNSTSTQLIYKDIFRNNATLATLLYQRFQSDFMLLNYSMDDYV